MRDRLGVIDCLSAGYRFLGRRLDLLIAPILLDLLFWLGPRLSVAPLFRQAANFYTQTATMEGMPTEMVDMSKQMATLLAQSGENSNLLGVLANSSLLHVPTLLAGSSPISARAVIEIQSPLAAILLLLGFSLIGLLIGVIYMTLLARTLPIGDGPKPTDVGSFFSVVVRHWVMVLVYAVVLIGALIVGAIPITLVTALLSLISPVIGSLIFMLLSGALLVLSFYLYFVTSALIMDNLSIYWAVRQSFWLVRNNFWATLGFVVLSNVITLGFAFILANVSAITPIGTIAAILVFTYIGTGLAMALLVFYRTRVLKQDEKVVALA